MRIRMNLRESAGPSNNVFSSAGIWECREKKNLEQALEATADPLPS